MLKLRVQAVLTTLAAFASDPEEEQRLKHLASTEGKVGRGALLEESPALLLVTDSEPATVCGDWLGSYLLLMKVMGVLLLNRKTMRTTFPVLKGRFWK